MERDLPGVRTVLLHRQVAHVRVVAHDQLDDRVDEVTRARGACARRRGGGGAVAVEHGDLGAVFRHDEGVRERREAVALRPVEHDDRLLDDDAPRHLHVGTTGEERVVQHGERVGRRVGTGAEQCGDLVGLAGGDAAHPHALGLEIGVERVVHHASVAHDHQPRPLAGLGRDRTTAGRGLVARLAHLLGGNRVVVREVELTDAAVAPDLLGRGRPLDLGEAFDGGGAARRQPLGAGETARCFGSEVVEHRHSVSLRWWARCYPTLPSMLSSISRESSTAYSIGSVLTIGSMNPLTIIAVACCSVRPRLIR